MSSQDTKTRTIKLHRIRGSLLSPREVFPESSMRELMASIDEAGLLQPLLVRPIQGEFEVVCGERRCLALKRLGRQTALCIVREMDDEQALLATLQENVHRQQLNPMEEARAYAMLVSMGLSQREVARKVGVSQSTVCVKLQLLKLHPKLQEMVLSCQLPESKARVLAAVEDQQVQLLVAETARARRWSAQELSRYAQCLVDDGQTTFEGITGYEQAVAELRDSNEALFDPRLDAQMEVERLASRFTRLGRTVRTNTRFLAEKREATATLMGARRDGFREMLEQIREDAAQLVSQVTPIVSKLSEGD